jgi:two-component system response regulator (stage 0 sporulation protein F)
MTEYRLLIVDDNREVRTALREAVETLGPDFEVMDVPSGEEALLELSSNDFDLLVMDVRLPGMDGLELLRRVKENQPDIKNILMTGLMDSQIRQDVADAGAEYFFFKPIEYADFLDAIERCLGLVEEPRLKSPSLGETRLMKNLLKASPIG